MPMFDALTTVCERSTVPIRSYTVAPVTRTGTISPTGSTPSTITMPSISGASRYDRPMLTPSFAPSTSTGSVRPTNA